MKLFYTSENLPIPNFCIGHINFFPFDLEKDKWIYTENLRDSEVIPLHVPSYAHLEEQYNNLMNLGYNNQLLLFMDIFHADERRHVNQYVMSNFYRSKNINNFLYIHTDSNKKDGVYYDHLYNRQKYYMTMYNYDMCRDRTYTLDSTEACYKLDTITHDFESDYIFLSPSRIYTNFDHERLLYRKKLRDFLLASNIKGFCSDPPNVILEPEDSGLLKNMNTNQGGGGTWYPIANHYYQKTYFSTYVETITTNIDSHTKEGYYITYNYKTITEKTYDPLIKGHFILPFGYQHMLKDILNYGFKVPNFIDYSYDDENNNQLRFEKFLSSLKKLLKIKNNHWKQFYIKNKDILEHNRAVFFNRPLHGLYNKVLLHYKKIR